MSARTVTAIFDSAADTQRARDRIVKMGVAPEDVRVINQLTDKHGDQVEGHGLWESIKDAFRSDDERSIYTEGMRRGGYLLSALVPEHEVVEAMRILEECNAIDLDERQRQWRNEGWSNSADPLDDEDASASSTDPRGRFRRDDSTLPR